MDQSQPNAVSNQTSQAESKKLVIIAEDDKYYGNIYKTILAKEGYRVEVVGNGEQAMAAIRKEKPTLLLLDLVMPVKDGFQVLKDLKANPALQSIKVVVLSNLGQEEDIKKAKELGASEYLVKSDLSMNEMMGKIKEHL